MRVRFALIFTLFVAFSSQVLGRRVELFSLASIFAHECIFDICLRIKDKKKYDDIHVISFYCAKSGTIPGLFIGYLPTSCR